MKFIQITVQNVEMDTNSNLIYVKIYRKDVLKLDLKMESVVNVKKDMSIQDINV